MSLFEKAENVSGDASNDDEDETSVIVPNGDSRFATRRACEVGCRGEEPGVIDSELIFREVGELMSERSRSSGC
jgi:hypothetical protein